jgi:septal ring factor EnvC (AmiA/AmiB activator)
MKNWKSLLITAAALALMHTVPDVRGQSPLGATNSVQSSQSSDTRANEPKAAAAGLVEACAAAADELAKSRVLVDALETENASLKTRLETEKRTTTILTELNETRRSESDALKAALAAKNETIAAKDAVIASQDKLIAALKQKKSSPWRRLGDVLIGAAVFAILK